MMLLRGQHIVTTRPEQHSAATHYLRDCSCARSRCARRLRAVSAGVDRALVSSEGPAQQQGAASKRTILLAVDDSAVSAEKAPCHAAHCRCVQLRLGLYV